MPPASENPCHAAFSLRPATAVDQPTIKALIRAVGINPLGLNWRRFLVAVDAQDTLIGCGQVKPHRDGTRELASIAVDPNWRRQGVARALIEALMARESPPLWLTCASPRVPLYLRFGFREVEDTAVMPPTFRRYTRLFRLFQTITRQNNIYLAVMVWHPTP